MANNDYEDIVDLEKIYTSDFNEAKYQILRINFMWNNCNKFRRNGQLINWKWELDNIWDEIEPKVRKSQDKLSERSIKVVGLLDAKIKKYEYSQNSQELYFQLRTKQRYLKWLQEEIGMGGKMSSDEDDDIEE